MSILMLGWEYPPKITGGLGVASQGVAEGLASLGYSVSFLLPKKELEHVGKTIDLIDASLIEPDPELWMHERKTTEIVRETALGELVLPYLPPQIFRVTKEREVELTELVPTKEKEFLDEIELTGSYEKDLKNELNKYGLLALQIAQNQAFELVYAHDWVTFLAGKMVKEATGIPLVVHVHSTEFERNGGHAQESVKETERHGMEVADAVIVVSQRTKSIISQQYQIDEHKIHVIPNAVSIRPGKAQKRRPKHVGFIGRLTEQKAPSTFLDLARDLRSRGHDFDYTMVGDGHLRNQLEEKSKAQNLKVKFTGFVDRSVLLRKFSSFDLLVVPSSSEPFGLITLEAIMKKIPVAAAKGSGVAEFVPSLPQAEGWDHYNFTSLIERLMKDEDYRSAVIEDCYKEGSRLSWSSSCKRLDSVLKGL